MPSHKFRIPELDAHWEQAVKDADLAGKTIHTLQSLSSGSKIIPSEFLTFRIICVPHAAGIFDAEKWELTEHMVRAQSLLTNHFSDFSNYLQSVRLDMGVTQKGPGDQLPLGIFEIPRNHQRHVLEADRLTSQKVRLVDPDHVDAWRIVPTTDEEIVNFAIVDWLQAVCMKMPGVHGQWIASRYQFRARFGTNELEARTDGVLRIFDEPERVHALIECKLKLARTLCHRCNFKRLRRFIFMVSEDRDEIFLTFGTLDRHYLRYLHNSDAPKRFLELHTYGPFRIDSAVHMEQLAGIVLAYVLRVGTGR
ncbi:hypothetical protein IFM58399_04889 [Aspergillus lentulus]|uniref:Fungal-type protein kinase domain-containing protein n=1 Tax=Aspergillus lentulus TaxID=293939 RepID=A0ABQ1AAS9_ASPLE|nr:uncharacterized protein IFM58399_04889 [Aspergillus lentulus]GFF37427.1 hypothetical protein IFM58399_04889 [Aspergillus lentulus]GFF50635.1 hypothetical protein IFM62136_01584 [Aspergillus lentulus]GFF66091.1 hypothetical protein IFM47457_01261 [Aspergillus lentulus]GFF77697.1 hypothetical protein IFM60648_05024 [Aspergillus lentulus]GFG02143.1 hypothetical protein IFM61392_02143 [Aspergillus lentulus]